MQPPKKVEIPLEKFLKELPPNQPVFLERFFDINPRSRYVDLSFPPLTLFCEEEDGERNFDPERHSLSLELNNLKDLFLQYKCRNCKSGYKFYSLVITPKEDGCDAIKLGEHPLFGERLSPKTITLIGPDREFFLKGHRAENKGLGIGAFAYYRRVVQNQKKRIIGEILKTAERERASSSVIESLKKAQDEDGFGRFSEDFRDAIPNSLRFEGHSPLYLLNKALSSGLHEEDDAVCLELARTIRLVLTFLAERISEMTKDQQELKEAIGKLSRKESLKEGNPRAGTRDDRKEMQ